MNKQNKEFCLSDQLANPAPLGLVGFGMTTVLLNIHNAGFFPLDSMILGMGIFVGGIAQLFAGGMEFLKKNTFGTTAFTSYGLFWLSLVHLWLFPRMGFMDAPTPESIGYYLLMWGVFTFFMFFGTLKTNRVLQGIFFSLAVLFFLLAIGDFTGSKLMKTIAGYEGIFTGGLALYSAMAQVINEANGRETLPLWPVQIAEKNEG